MFSFSAEIEIIGVNPFVFVPHEILHQLFAHAGKTKGYIPIKGTINGQAYTQTLVRYRGEWRLYINMIMLKDSPKRVGERVELAIAHDPDSREIEAPPAFLEALAKNELAQAVFEHLSASRKLEIVRYLAKLKSAEALEKNIKRALLFLEGKERFVGRDKS